LIEYFNSDVGLVNKGKNDLELLQALLEKHPKVEVDNEIQEVKSNLGCVEWVSASLLKKLSRSTLDKTINELQILLNKISKAVLEKISPE